MSFQMRNQKSVDMLVEQFKLAFSPETNRERALMQLLGEGKNHTWMTRDELHEILKQEFPLRSSTRFCLMSADYIVQFFLDGKIENAPHMTESVKKYVQELRGEGEKCTNCGSTK